MTIDEFVTAKNEARERLGLGTLVCYLSAETMEEVRKAAFSGRERGTSHGRRMGPADLSDDIIFRIVDGVGVKFFRKEDTERAPYVVYD